MHRIDGPGATVDNKFTEGDPVSAVPATEVTGDWLNAVQEEIAAVIVSAGLTLNKANNAQLLAAIVQKINAAIPASPPSASTTVKGIVELATSAETISGTDTERAITPAGLASTTATVSRAGLVELATNTETQDGTDTQRAVTPASLSARVGTESQSGILQLATQAEAMAGTESSKAMTAIRVAQSINSRLAAEYSAQYTVSPGSIFSITHSKGIDASIEFVFVCLVADAGYSPGDECEAKDWRYSPLNSAQNYGVFITSRNANSFNMVMASGTTWFIPHKTTAASTSIVVARWAVKARIKS